MPLKNKILEINTSQDKKMTKLKTVKGKTFHWCSHYSRYNLIHVTYGRITKVDIATEAGSQVNVCQEHK